MGKHFMGSLAAGKHSSFDKSQTLKAKGIAICLLLFHHLFYFSSRIEAVGVVFRFLSQGRVETLAAGARVCVWIFAFLSAYGLTKQYGKLGDAPTAQSRTDFIKRHYLSLMKPYWFIFVITFLCSFFIFKDPVKLYEGNVLYGLLCVFGISDFFGTPMPVGAWWYMCFAQILLLLLPFLAELCRKFGALTLMGSFILTQYLDAGIFSKYGGSYIDYFFVVVLGVYFAQNNVMEKLSRKSSHWYLQLLEACLLLAGICFCTLVHVRHSSGDSWKITKVFMAASAVLICIFAFKYLTFRWVEALLSFLGKHSGNIFLVHPFAYIYYPKLVYWSHNVILTWITLMAFGLVVSIAIEALKKLMRRSSFLKKLV